MCVIRCYTVKDGLEKVEKYSWDPSRRVNKALLKKSKASRFEIWIPEEEANNVIEKGWFPAVRSSDGSVIISRNGNQLFTFPKRELKPFPY